ncbi:hypothetical protein [Streptomyces syringium]|uniref:hypothetical protein n=1 Tax=Streptomyces syringium TaxID=76729 RepID=UPI0033CA836B
MPRTIALQHPLDDTGLPHRQTPAQPTPAPAPAVADVARYHHPHFVRAEPGRSEGGVLYYFAPFTGREPEPEVPLAVYKDTAVTWEQSRELRNQYEAARIMWSKARLRLEAAPLLRRAAPLWEAWASTLAELRRVFGEFWSTADGQWRAQLLRLTDAERAARKAAGAWDGLAEQLAKLADAQVRVAGEYDELELGDVAREIGLDAKGWWIEHISEYEPVPYSRHDTPVVGDLNRVIEEQRERLREVAGLAGDRADRALA